MTTRPVPRILSVGFASLGLLTLAGCAVESASADTNDTTTSETSENSTSSTSSTDTASSTYADGTYTVDASYQAPSGIESIEVVLTLADDTVTAVTVTGDASDREASEYQERFSSAISAEVVGQDISSLSVSRVAGASLTSNGFNSALEEIRSQAS